MKTCRLCGEVKDTCEFYKHPWRFEATISSCKSCERERSLARYYKRREAIRAVTRTDEWRLKRKLTKCLGPVRGRTSA